MKKLLFGAMLLVLPFSVTAISTGQLNLWVEDREAECMGEDELLIVLTHYEERLFIRDVDSTVSDRFSVWVNPETRTWTAVVTNAVEKSHCIISYGKNLQYLGEW